MRQPGPLTRFAKTFLPASAAALILSACATEKPVPVHDLRPWKPIKWKCADTEETRKQVIAHNSVYASLKSGKKVVYADDCPQGKPST